MNNKIKKVRDYLFKNKLSRNSRYNFPLSDAKFYQQFLIKAQSRIINNGQIILGSGVNEFERNFSLWLKNNLDKKQILGVASGTDALELALRGLKICPGDLVAIPSHTAYATAASILRIGAKPIFVDINNINFTICPESLNETLIKNPNIKAVITVHLYGGSCEIDKICKICSNFSIPFIEDCAQACGTKYLNRSVGTFGDFSTFSFYPTKNLAALGDGGALLINKSDSNIMDFRSLRTYGWNSDREAIRFGVNSRLDELQAILLSEKLKDLDIRINQRRKLAELYHKLLFPLIGNSDLLSLPKSQENETHSYHLYVIRVNHKKRDLARKFCLKRNIPVSIHYPKAIHQNSFFSGHKTSLPNTERIVKEILSLPLSPYMKYSDVYKVVETLLKIL